MALIPKRLRQAHEDRSVVFFCGAGVSMPAGLPSFKGLTEQILNALAHSKLKEPLPWKAFKDDRFDQALGILEDHSEGGYGIEVRKKAHEILQTKSDRKRLKLDAHLSLCRLANLNMPLGRLVTTNFDPLFEKALDRLRRRTTKNYRTPIEVAPALSPPKKDDGWSGLVYLHGRLAPSGDGANLVLTAADFGKAYLLDGWARRFITDLFRHFQIVFVGYSIVDPTMHYLVTSRLEMAVS